MEIILAPNAPQPAAQFSQAVRVGNLVFCSGVIGLDPVTMTVVEGLEPQIRQACANLSAVLAAAGCAFADVVKCTVFTTEMESYAQINRIYGEYFSSKPARSAIGVAALPLGALVEIEAVAEVR
jgi:2-iminobutanoate/2-iminopropanoate deaminase